MIDVPSPVRLTNRRRFGFTLGTTAIVLLFGCLALWGAQREQRSRIEVDASHRSVETLQLVLTRLADAEAGQRGFLLTGRERYLQQYTTAKGDVLRELAGLRARTRNSQALSRLDSLGDVMAARFADLEQTIAARGAGALPAQAIAREADRGIATMGEARRLVTTLQQQAFARLSARNAREDRDSQLLFIILALGTAAAALASLVLNRWLVRNAEVQQAFADSLGQANQELQDQQLELELQHEQLQEQSVELERRSDELEERNTELELLTEELERRTDAAESANQAKAGFLAAMSHDVRTPLSAMLGYVDLLDLGIRGPMNESQRHDLDAIRSSGKRLLALFNDMLSFARIEAGRLDIHLQDVPLESVFAELEASFLPQVEARGLHYTREMCDPLVAAEVDPEKVAQIVLNLITNAVKFTEPGGSIAVSCAAQGERVSLQVRDTGSGIPADMLQRIFEPFVQVGANGTAHHQGVGLGLAISRELARAMGGDLAVESEVGRGSCFTLTVARAAGANGHRVPAEARSAWRAAADRQAAG
jgi:signal transduction histidine kinase